MNVKAVTAVSFSRDANERQPMIVLGSKTVSFMVIQYMNGIPEDDCKETHLSDQHITVHIPRFMSAAARSRL